jgi:hypothetical protein
MSTNDFRSELRSVVGRFADQLTDEVATVILKRLGMKNGAVPTAAKGKRPAAPQNRSRAPAVAAAQRDRIASFVTKSKGVSLSDIGRATGITSGALKYSLKLLRKQKKVYMAGDRGTARYAGNQALADAAHKKALTG